MSVYQYPVYGYLKVENEDAVGTYYYEPIGLYTIGPDKGDKPTFGYDNSTYKSTLIHMEGTDHSPRGVGMDYPWEQMTVGEDVMEGFSVVASTEDMIKVKNLGKKSLEEVIFKLQSLGLELRKEED